MQHGLLQEKVIAKYECMLFAEEQYKHYETLQAPHSVLFTFFLLCMSFPRNCTATLAHLKPSFCLHHWSSTARRLWLTEFPGCCRTGILDQSRRELVHSRGTESLCQIFQPSLLSFSVWLSLPHVSFPSSWLWPRSAASSSWNACWREKSRLP